MRLMRLGPAGAERPVVRVDDEHYVDVSDVIEDIDAHFFATGGPASLEPIVAQRIAAGETRRFTVERIGPPIARPHQILCVGLNYRDHALEAGMAIPDEPVLFSKSPNTLVGPDDDVIMPRGATKLDYEVELGIVIGRRASYLESEEDAREAIAGYVLVNDVSERAFQLERGGQWTKGKSAETFNPAGPWLATPASLGDVLALAMRLDVNGERRQTGSTATMIFPPWVIVQYLSRFLVLEPGDLIDTGTPPGVGLGMDPPRYLAVGDVVELAIDGLGSQRQRIVSARPSTPVVAGRASREAPVAVPEAAAPGTPARPPVGMQLYTVRDDLADDPRATLRRVAELGLRVVEPYDLVAFADRLAGPMAEYGLTAPTSHVSFIHADLEAALAAAARLGVGTIIDPYVPEEHWTSRAGVAAVAAALNGAARRAAELGITVGYHNHWWELEARVDGAPALEVFADLLDDEVILELDTYWCAVGGEDPVALLARLGERVAALHIKDGPISRDVASQQPAGSGRMPVAAILAAAPHARPILEFDAYAGDLYDGVSRAITFVRRHGAGL